MVELPSTEALDTAADGRIADAGTILLLQRAALRGPCAGRPRADPGPGTAAGN